MLRRRQSIERLLNNGAMLIRLEDESLLHFILAANFGVHLVHVNVRVARIFDPPIWLDASRRNRLNGFRRSRESELKNKFIL